MDSMLLGGILVAALVIGAVGRSWMRSQRARSTAAQDDQAHDFLAGWAVANGWKIAHGTDPLAHQDAELIAGLIGLPGDDQGVSGLGAASKQDEDFQSALRWEHGTILTRDTAAGRLQLIEARSEDGVHERVFAGLRSKATLPIGTLDCLAGGSPRQIGEPVGDRGQRPEALVEGLGLPWRVRLITGWILISGRGRLDPPTIERLGQRLPAFEAQFDRRPDRGPMS